MITDFYIISERRNSSKRISDEKKERKERKKEFRISVSFSILLSNNIIWKSVLVIAAYVGMHTISIS